MPLPPGEPDSLQAVASWVHDRTQRRDHFAHIHRASEEHRVRHGPTCTVYPTGSGATLGALAAAIDGNRVLEVGCGLGYSSLWLAFGSSPDRLVETIEQDRSHAEIARRHFQQEGYENRITVHQGHGAEVLPRLTGPYDLIFCDGDIDASVGRRLRRFLLSAWRCCQVVTGWSPGEECVEVLEAAGYGGYSTKQLPPHRKNSRQREAKGAGAGWLASSLSQCLQAAGRRRVRGDRRLGGASMAFDCACSESAS